MRIAIGLLLASVTLHSVGDRLPPGFMEHELGLGQRQHVAAPAPSGAVSTAQLRQWRDLMPAALGPDATPSDFLPFIAAMSAVILFARRRLHQSN